MTQYCYLHPDKEAFKKCSKCGKPICHKCAKSYWYSNTIFAMFSPQKDAKEKITLCPKCLRKEKLKNFLVTATLLILILEFIVVTIAFSASRA